MVDTSEVLKAGGTIVVLAGATARKGALEAVANSLRRRGVEVRFASGIERSMVGLLQLSFRYREDSAYLLCGGPELPKPELDRLVAAINANGAPADRVWAGELDWARPESLSRDIEHRLAALGVDVGPETSPSKTVASPKTPPPPRTASPKPPVSRTVVAVGGPRSPIPASKLPDPVVPPTPPNAGPPSLAANVARKSRTPSVNVPVVSSSSGAFDEEDAIGIDHGPVRRFLSSSVGKGVAAGAALMLVGVVAWRVSAADAKPGASEGERADASVMEASVAAQPDVIEAAEAPVVNAEDPAEPEPDPERVKAAEPPEAAAAPVPSEVAVPPAEEAPAAEAEPEVEVQPEPPAPNSPEDRELVYAALENQSIRAIDILLVSPTATKPRRRRRVTARMRFDAAKTYCEELVVDGVGSWRLPDVGEAGWLTRANILREGTYWTETKADAFGVERVVWNSRNRRMGTTHTRWKGGRVVCVRYQRPPSEEEG